MQGRILYQIITEPVPVSETPSVASWHSQISQPTLRKGPSAAVQSSLAFVGSDTARDARWFAPLSEPVRGKRPAEHPAIAYANFAPAVVVETVTVDKYYQWLTEPVRRGGLTTACISAPGLTAVLGPVSSPGDVAYASTNTIVPYSRTLLYQSIADPVPISINTAWFSPLSEPTRRKPIVQPDGLSFIGSDTARDARWFSPLSEPTRRKPTVQPDALSFVGSDTARDARWFAPLSEPTRRRATVQPDGLSFVYAPAAAETITVDKWLVPLADAPRRKPAIQPNALSFVYAPAVETVTLDKWFTPLADAPRRKATIQPDALSFVWIITGTNDVAFASTNIIVPYVRTVLYQSLADPVPVVATGETVTVDKWIVPLANVPARKPTVQPDAVSFVGSDTARDARWFTPLNEPTRRKPLAEFPALSFSNFTPAETVTVDKYYNWLSEPVRARRVAEYPSLSFANFTPAAETSTVDKYYQSLSEPVRARRAADYAALSFANFTPAAAEVVTVDKYYNWLSEPVRYRLGLPVYDQQALALVPFQNDVNPGFIAPLSQPTYRKSDISARPMLFEPPSELVRPDKWFSPLALPTRLRTTPTAAQPYLFFVKAEPFAEAVSADRWQQPLSEPIRTRGLKAFQIVGFSYIAPVQVPVSTTPFIMHPFP